MARQFHVEIQRGDVNSELYVYDDDKIEIISADSNVKGNYLIRKQIFIQDLAAWAREYGVESLEIVKIAE